MLAIWSHPLPRGFEMPDTDILYWGLGSLLAEHIASLGRAGGQAASSAGAKAVSVAGAKRPNFAIRSEGTLVKENEKLYWFENDFTGVLIQPPQATNLFTSALRRKLTPFETGLVLSRPINGSINVTLVSMLVPNADAPLGLAPLNVKRVVIGYFVRHRENASRFAYGDVIGTAIFYDIDGNILRKVSETRRSEPGLETPLLDPIDFLGGVVADFGRLGAKALFRAVVDVLERDAADAVVTDLEEIVENRAGKIFEDLSKEELEGIRGGAARPGGEPRPFTADELNKPIPKAKGQGGPKRKLEKNERLGVIEIVGVLERVSQTSASTPQEIKNAIEAALPTRRVKELARELKGWTEIDVLGGNGGWNNTMRVIYKVQNDVWEIKLLEMHGKTPL